jgi:serine/threonine protein kinase
VLPPLPPAVAADRYAFCKKTSRPLAIKTYKKRKLSPLNRCQVAREIHIHAQLDHPNIIALVSGGHQWQQHSTARHSMA